VSSGIQGPDDIVEHDARAVFLQDIWMLAALPMNNRDVVLKKEQDSRQIGNGYVLSMYAGWRRIFGQVYQTNDATFGASCTYLQPKSRFTAHRPGQ